VDAAAGVVYYPRMLLRRYGTFTGGIDLPDEKQATEDLPVRISPRLQRLAVPLAPFGGPAAEPVVPVGEGVTIGEKIARAAGADGVDIFAPLDGRFTGLCEARVAVGGTLHSSPAMELKDLGHPQVLRSPPPTFDWRAASNETLHHRLSEGGLVLHRRSPRPLTAFLQEARHKRPRVLIGNGMENQPYVAADHRLLVEHGVEVIRGLSMLARAVKAAETILAVDQRRTDDYRELIGPARSYGITLVALPHKYPIGAEPMLVKVLTRRETPAGGSTMDVGAAVLNPPTCLAAYRWVAGGMPPVARVVTIAGEHIDHPANAWVPFGALCEELAAGAAPPLIHGGPMTGVRCEPNTVVTAATDAVLALAGTQVPHPTPCIRCGWCTDHCPARLNVAALNDAFELARPRAARRLGVVACVECGVCSYVCPARLPLSQRVSRLKRTAIPRQRRVIGAKDAGPP